MVQNLRPEREKISLLVLKYMEPHYSFREGGAGCQVVIQTSDKCKVSTTRGKRFPWQVGQTVGRINLVLRLKVGSKPQEEGQQINRIPTMRFNSESNSKDQRKEHRQRQACAAWTDCNKKGILLDFLCFLKPPNCAPDWSKSECRRSSGSNCEK